jgi:hypothetical protein
MAYNKFKGLEQIETDFGINTLQRVWMPEILPQTNISQFLTQSMLDARDEALETEKAKSEFILAPILKELKRSNPNTFSTFSGYQFDVDKSINLNGFCDFILSAEPQKVYVTAPIFCMVEAKRGVIEEGWGQCGAEMYAAQIFNARAGVKRTVYGCVTNAFSWCFLKLEDKALYIDPNYVPLTFTEPHRVMNVLQWILDVSLKK